MERARRGSKLREKEEQGLEKQARRRGKGSRRKGKWGGSREMEKEERPDQRRSAKKRPESERHRSSGPGE